jgi:TRAP-type C4-dicarboxylate transport system substrate-binding protein
MKVIGQPTNTGRVQNEFERPFFENLARETGLPLSIEYIPLELSGMKDTHQLSMLRDHTIDFVSLRMVQNSKSEPKLAGIDLPGMNIDFKTGRRVVEAYAPVVDQSLQDNFGAKLMGVWLFGPQIVFCRRPIGKLNDLAGMTVRVAGESFTPLLSAIGAVPVVMPFEEVQDALKLGLIDCALSSATSANSAGWPEYTSYLYPLAMQLGMNGYAISLDLWNQLSAHQQKILQQAFERNIEQIWTFAEGEHENAISCNTGGPCASGKKYHMILVKPTLDDINTLHDAMSVSVKKWEALCNETDVTCSQEWHRILDPIFELKPTRTQPLSP